MTKYVLVSSHCSVDTYDNDLNTTPTYLGEYNTIENCKFEASEGLTKFAKEFANDMLNFENEEKKQEFIRNYLRHIEVNDTVEQDLTAWNNVVYLTWYNYDNEHMYEKITYAIQKIER